MDNKIKWNQIKTVSGYGTGLPETIQRLISPIEAERKRASNGLDNVVVVQSTLYEAAYYVIEPILELLEKDYTVDRFEPLTVLAEIALGWGGKKEIILQECGEQILLEKACRNKLKELKPRIEKIVTCTQKEREEKDCILETIDEFWQRELHRFAPGGYKIYDVIEVLKILKAQGVSRHDVYQSLESELRVSKVAKQSVDWILDIMDILNKYSDGIWQ